MVAFNVLGLNVIKINVSPLAAIYFTPAHLAASFDSSSLVEAITTASLSVIPATKSLPTATAVIFDHTPVFVPVPPSNEYVFTFPLVNNTATSFSPKVIFFTPLKPSKVSLISKSPDTRILPFLLIPIV